MENWSRQQIIDIVIIIIEIMSHTKNNLLKSISFISRCKLLEKMKEIRRRQTEKKAFAEEGLGSRELPSFLPLAKKMGKPSAAGARL
jgi:hypothetical protein